MAALLDIYLPALRTFLIESRHISLEQADDLLQEFVLSKLLTRKLFKHVDRSKGRFRSYIVKSLSNFVNTKIRSETSFRTVTILDETIDCVSEERNAIDEFDRQWVRQVVLDALQLMEADCRAKRREDLWEIFQARVAEPLLSGSSAKSYTDLVERYQIKTPRQAINLLVTAKRCFTRNLRKAISRYVRDESEIDEEIKDLLRIVG